MNLSGRALAVLRRIVDAIGQCAAVEMVGDVIFNGRKAGDEDILAERVADATPLDTTTRGQKTPDDASDVAAELELFRLIDTDAFYAETEATDAGQYVIFPNIQTFTSKSLKTPQFV